ATPSAGTDEQAALNTIALYNQASIEAGSSGRPDAMAPFVASDSRVWAAIQKEYARRAKLPEIHEPTLTRWGVLRVEVQGDMAIVETQEQWDDITSVDSQVLTSRRGILTRNAYTLHRDGSSIRWLIADIATTTIIK
ncbi:MAG TPA: hypothetical protein VFO07_16850, partial [Roseiflexaceae bacterium]|nr:hypothetical protein [Roseiflexaceae bacterium]